MITAIRTMELLPDQRWALIWGGERPAGVGHRGTDRSGDSRLSLPNLRSSCERLLEY
jgi:hypothetical protein